MTRPRWRWSAGITKLDRLSPRKFSNKFAKVTRCVCNYHERRTFVLFCTFWKSSWSRVEEEDSLGGTGLSQEPEGSPPTDAGLVTVKRKAYLAILKWVASLKQKTGLDLNTVFKGEIGRLWALIKWESLTFVISNFEILHLNEEIVYLLKNNFALKAL